MANWPIELATVSEKNLGRILRSLDGYLKVASMVWIRALRQPTPDGLVLSTWSRSATTALLRFCQRHRIDEVLVRTDKRGSRWAARRGGYILPVRDVRRLVADLSCEDTITALLEPLSPYRDRYCIACVTVPTEERMVLEVVGPGFDTSDLLRSDVLPHERLEIRTPFRELEQRPRLALEVVQVYRVSELAYRKTVDERLVKIGARLINPAFPEDLLKTEEVERARLRERAVVHLTKSRETTLLRNMSAYRPIPARHAVRFAKGVLHVLAGLSNHGVVLGATAFSGTFTTSGRFIFWDFFPADSSQAGMLYKS